MKTLTLNQVFEKPQYVLSTGISMGDSVEDMASGKDDTFDFDIFLESKGIPLQRPIVWTLLQKQQLIWSLIKGIKIPPFTVVIKKDDDYNKTWRRTILVVDGKQRLTALFKFVRNEFPITVNGEDFYYRDFDDKLKYKINHADLTYNCVYSYSYRLMTDDKLIHLFDYCNFLGTPQDVDHLESIKNTPNVK